ncbi:MAG: hypothetical protein KGH59_04270 [Candidatus Micrarchaeota archaeon]|nr:hypothetical protein [Candidatus Micrarchaeota archaeon]MDE1804967.1 hypothetical protein [Candidatus Micrarchaeota archaeon]MDE1847179.1 hypothetical protein [Candidatus Micrarchaeota archaeon]
MAKADETLERILQEVQISNFFLVIFVGIMLLVFISIAGSLRLISMDETLLIGIVVLICFVIYLIDFLGAKKYRHVLRHVGKR